MPQPPATALAPPTSEGAAAPAVAGPGAPQGPAGSVPMPKAAPGRPGLGAEPQQQSKAPSGTRGAIPHPAVSSPHLVQRHIAQRQAHAQWQKQQQELAASVLNHDPTLEEGQEEREGQQGGWRPKARQGTSLRHPVHERGAQAWRRHKQVVDLDAIYEASLHSQPGVGSSAWTQAMQSLGDVLDGDEEEEEGTFREAGDGHQGTGDRGAVEVAERRQQQQKQEQQQQREHEQQQQQQEEQQQEAAESSEAEEGELASSEEGEWKEPV